MHRMVLQVFKVIALSMIFVFVWDMVFYLYRAFSLNQRMESINVSLQKVVSENNYLPVGQYNMFNSIYNNIGESFNEPGSKGNDINDFIVYADSTHAVQLNYEQPAQNTKPIKGFKVEGDRAVEVNDITKKQLNQPADYGDVMCVQATVRVNQPIWGFLGGDAHNANNWSKVDKSEIGTLDEKWRYSDAQGNIGDGTTTFTYTYYVPCLKYQSVTN